MHTVQVPEILAKDLLSGKSKYIENGIITFDCISFEPNIEGDSVVRFYFEGDLLASMHFIAPWAPGDSLNFQLSKGTMEMTISASLGE